MRLMTPFVPKRFEAVAFGLLLSPPVVWSGPIRMIPVLAACVLSFAAVAQEDIPEPVPFGDGEISFARGEDDEIAVTFNGQEIYRNYSVRFDRLVKVSETNVALVLGGPGGNACGPATLIITQPEGSVDAKVDIVGEECGAPSAAVSPDEILFVPYLVPGAKKKLQKWTPETGLTVAGEISYAPREGSSWENLVVSIADHPYALLENADVYLAAQSLTGDKFDELVLLLGVAGPPEIIEQRYVAAPGCQAHACGAANGFLGLDLEKSQVFAAMKYSDENSTTWPADIASWPEPLKKAWEASIAP